MVKGEVTVLSKHTIRPTPRAEEEEESPKRIHLTPWDIMFISIGYIQRGIIFHKPTHNSMELTISSLLSSFSATVNHFYPLAGRLVTTNHGEDSLSISIDCTDQGADFVHATALHVSISDLLTPGHYIPPVINSLFAGETLLSHDGHVDPLLTAQVTELADGIFVGVTLNHAAADGTFFWHMFNTWAEICRTNYGTDRIIGGPPPPPVIERRFPSSFPPPYILPFRDARDFVRELPLPAVGECFFHFPAESIGKLKSKANAEVGAGKEISSLQSLLAHAWRSVTRARGLEPEEETSYVVAVGYRSRHDPPLPSSYLGNAIAPVRATASAGEVAGRGLGWAAWQINRAIASHDVSTEAAESNWVGPWKEGKPDFVYLDEFSPESLFTGSSPRFDVYGNDFGWGRPVAVRGKRDSKFDGQVTVYPGPEIGSMGLEVCLYPKAMTALLEDVEFMETVAK